MQKLFPYEFPVSETPTVLELDARQSEILLDSLAPHLAGVDSFLGTLGNAIAMMGHDPATFSEIHFDPETKQFIIVLAEE